MAAKKKAGAPQRKSGFYELPDGQKLMSVTTTIGHGVPKDLLGWATWEVAKLAMESLPRLTKARGSSARWREIDWLKEAHTRVRDSAASFGSTFHDIAEAKVVGKPFPEPSPEQAPFVQAFENFVEDHKPVFHAAELTVANPDHGWAGRCDAWCELPEIGDGISVIDYKSGRNAHAEAALQMACYQRATVGWLDDGTEVVPPKAVRAYVLHVRPEKHPDRGYALIPADTSDEVYEFFLAAQKVAEWSVTRSKKALGKPVVLGEIEEAA